MSEQLPQLPDGSSFFTADVMSKEEAMALPLNKRPICYRISSEMYHAVFEAVGEASTCWRDGQIPTGVFDTERASKIAVELCFKIANEVEKYRIPETDPNSPGRRGEKPTTLEQCETITMAEYQYWRQEERVDHSIGGMAAAAISHGIFAPWHPGYPKDEKTNQT